MKDGAAETQEVLEWLREQCDDFRFDVVAGYRQGGGEHAWPVVAHTPEELEQTLADRGHLVPLPKEPASLANIVEVALVDYLLHAAERDGVSARRGTERGYPDIELHRPGDRFHAIDVKVARLGKTQASTQSRVTLYTGNTYFRYPQLQWPGTFRPFRDYTSHLDVIALYRFDPAKRSRVASLEIVAHEAWRIGSRKRSSTTREYIGAVQNVDALRSGQGEFASADEFYAYWRKFPFRVGHAVQRQLDRLLAEQDASHGG